MTLEALKVRAVVSEGRWLRVGQVAEILGVSLGTARNYIDARRFRSKRLAGGDRRAWSADVERYAREMEDDPFESDADPPDSRP